MPESIYHLLNSHLSVSHETLDRLSLYRELLIKWQGKVNLVSNDSIADSWKRHFLDSLQLINHIPDLNLRMIDMGSGAGFPGMAIAIYGAPNVHLIESDSKKVLFLREVARITKTNIAIHHERVERLRGITGDVILSRALSDLSKLLDYAFPYISYGTICLFPKGKNYTKEIEEAKTKWSFDHDIIPSITDSQGVILKISHLKERI